MSSNDDDVDMYGFSKDVEYDRKNDYPNLKPNISVRKFAIYIIVGILVFFSYYLLE